MLLNTMNLLPDQLADGVIVVIVSLILLIGSARFQQEGND